MTPTFVYSPAEVLWDGESVRVPDLYDEATGWYAVPRALSDDRGGGKVAGVLAGMGVTDSSVILAVVDTGMTYNHPWIKGNVKFQKDLTGEGLDDLSGHGTAVTLIAVETYVRAGIRPQLMNVKVARADGKSTHQTLIDGLDWIADFATAHPEALITCNLSIGVLARASWFGFGPPTACAGDCEVCKAAIRLAGLGAMLGCASGNEGPDAVRCPASAALARKHPNLSSTGAIDDHRGGRALIYEVSKRQFGPP